MPLFTSIRFINHKRIHIMPSFQPRCRVIIFKFLVIYVYINLAVICFTTGCSSSENKTMSLRSDNKNNYHDQPEGILFGQISSATTTNDLLWLVGRWRCITREYIKANRRNYADSPMSYSSEDFLEFINVYYPYVDEKPILTLDEYPHCRPIAAEFLVRAVQKSPPFTERLLPMEPDGGFVAICKNHIVVGLRSKYIFKYQVVRDVFPPQILLESNITRLVLEKWSDDPGNIQSSCITEPIRFFSVDKIHELSRRYKELISNNRGTH